MLVNRQRLLPLFILLVIDGMGFGLVIPVLSPLIMDPNTSILPINTSDSLRHLYFGLTLAVFPTAVFLGTPVLGILSDRLGRRKVLLWCLGGSFVGLCLAASSIALNSIALLLIGRVLTGLASASQPIAQAAIADISSHGKKALNLSLIAFAMTVGMVAGPLAGGFLSDSHLFHGFSLQTPFIAASLLSAVNFVLMIFTFAETRDIKSLPQWTWHDNLSNCIIMFESCTLRRLIAGFLLIELAWSLYFQATPLTLAQRYHFSSEMIAIFITYLGLTMSVGLTVVFRAIVPYFSLEKIIRGCFLSAVASLLGCLLVHNQWLQWLMTIPLTIGVGIAYTALLALMSNHLNQHLQGWLMGFAAALLALAWAITGYMAAPLLHWHYQLPIMGALLLAGIGYTVAKFYGGLEQAMEVTTSKA
ncbi:MAG: hypothetical protein CMF50_07965 [Legionellales bacterium]|nr:hypothetical protein [Legionellales bacterium]|tara:strand:- start:25350 stop:26600 length:1251 start_codon:yes stop_codon:yes gene_type:complete